MREVCAEPYAQYTSNVEWTVGTTEKHNGISQFSRKVAT